MGTGEGSRRWRGHPSMGLSESSWTHLGDGSYHQPRWTFREMWMCFSHIFTPCLGRETLPKFCGSAEKCNSLTGSTQLRSWHQLCHISYVLMVYQDLCWNPHLSLHLLTTLGGGYHDCPCFIDEDVKVFFVSVLWPSHWQLSLSCPCH